MLVILNGQEHTFDIETDTRIPEDLDSLSKEACRIPGLLARYGQAVAELKAEQEQQKFNFEEKVSYVSDMNRQTTEKITEARIKELSVLSPDVREAKLEQVRALRDYSAVENCLKALYKKADIVIALLYQHRQEMKSYSGI